MFQLFNLVTQKWAELATAGVQFTATFRGDIYMRRD